MERKSLIVSGAALGAALVVRTIVRRVRAYDLADKVVLITGGSRGLGLVMARELVGRGARVAICARDTAELERARADLAPRGKEVLALGCDLTDPAQIDRLVADVRGTLGPIDVLVNNAGVIQVGPAEHMTDADFEHAMDTHFWAPLHLVQAVVPDMIARGGGRIVNVTSIGGKLAVPHLLPYTASKFALVGLSQGLRVELAKHNIRVTTAVPGLMRTGSAVKATFKGRHRDEYAWFAAGDSSHLTSMAAERAAHQIIEAMRHGQSEIVLSPQARLALRTAAIAPRFVQRVLEVVDRMLPGPGGIGEQSASGHDSKSETFLTRASDRAARRNNEV